MNRLINKFTLLTLLLLNMPLFFIFSEQKKVMAQSSVICESQNGKKEHCNLDTSNGVILYRELSNTPCQGNWQYGAGFIQVINGCRGDFHQGKTPVPLDSELITCNSHNGRKNRCNFDTQNGVILVEQLSNTSCEGNWRVGRGFIEVTNGCRAEFGQGKTH